MYRKIDVIDAYININDYPDFCDSYIIDACWFDSGELLSDQELDNLNNSDFIYEYCINVLF